MLPALHSVLASSCAVSASILSEIVKYFGEDPLKWIQCHPMLAAKSASAMVLIEDVGACVP